MWQRKNQHDLKGVISSCALQIPTAPALVFSYNWKKNKGQGYQVKGLLLPIKSPTTLSAKLVSHPNAN